jgi:hypothetical protein
MKGLTPLEKAMEAKRLLRENGEQKEIIHNWIVKAKRNPKSLKKAINAKCFECFGGTEDELPDSGWKKLIGTCTAPDCPLYPHRPYQNYSDDSAEEDESDEISTIDE